MRRLSALAFVLGVQVFGQDPLTVDHQHYKVEVDNAQVRALRVHYGPGEGSPMHEHPAGVRVFLADTHTQFTSPEGKTSDSTREAGTVSWAEPVRHANHNSGEYPIEMIELELKQLAGKPVQAMAKNPAPDRLETVLIENDAVRVLQAHVAAGQPIASHLYHDAVVISVLPNPDGHGPAPASVSWLPAGLYTLKGSASEATTLILVELKKR